MRTASNGEARGPQIERSETWGLGTDFKILFEFILTYLILNITLKYGIEYFDKYIHIYKLNYLLIFRKFISMY